MYQVMCPYSEVLCRCCEFFFVTDVMCQYSDVMYSDCKDLWRTAPVLVLWSDLSVLWSTIVMCLDFWIVCQTEVIWCYSLTDVSELKWCINGQNVCSSTLLRDISELWGDAYIYPEFVVVLFKGHRNLMWCISTSYSEFMW